MQPADPWTHHAPLRTSGDSGYSRRRALSIVLGAAGILPRPMSADVVPPIRLAVSESLISDVNINDARAAMQIWIKRMSQDYHLDVTLSVGIFDSTEEILRRARFGLLDAVALNILEYRQIADYIDSTQIVVDTGGATADQYLLLARRKSGAQHVRDLRGLRLTLLQTARMCVAPAWLAVTLDESRLGPSEKFFASVTTDFKIARVILPVFFGQADACLTSKRGYDTMCELNPQVATELVVLAASPAMVVTFHVFHKNYRGVSRERFAKVYTDVLQTAAGRQLATLFQFNGLVVRDASCLAPALSTLAAADRVRQGEGRK
jgi:phosphonate transport system substrate-binding protein